jgi:hypothetical protein
VESGEARYARAHGYTNVLKCEDDTFIHVPRLLASGWEQWKYTGRLCQAYHFPYTQGGAGYWIGEEALDRVAERPDEWWLAKNTLHHHSEDVGVGLVLKVNKIGLKPDMRYFHGSTPKWGWPTPDNNLITAHKCDAWTHQHLMEINA